MKAFLRGLAATVMGSALCLPAAGASGLRVVGKPALGPVQEKAVKARTRGLERAIVTDDGRIHLIVQLREPSVATYEGGVSGIPATSPRALRTKKLNARSAAALAYSTHLRGRQDAFEAAIKAKAPSVSVYERYQTVLNGVSLAVKPIELQVLEASPDVLAIYPDELMTQSLDFSVPFIGAPTFWTALGGSSSAGAGVKVAIIDSGIRPENPLFSGTGFSYPAGFPLATDWCAANPGFCNGKIIAARHFRTPALVPLHPSEYDSPLGFDGHGTHTAGIAAGNLGVAADAGDGLVETISGVAPRAFLLIYKALWWNGTTGSGSSTDLIAALNAAVADGADVINNSWGGSTGADPATSPYSPVIDAATAAGVVVVASAGNSGSAATTIGCPGCVESAITVANGLNGRTHAQSLDVTGPAPVPANLVDVAARAGVGPALGSVLSAPVVFAGAVNPANVLGCSAFPAASMTGAIALISRGTCSFLIKLQNAEAAGAVGTVVYNNVFGPPTSMGAIETTTKPSVMISLAAGQALSSFVVANPGATAQIDPAVARGVDATWTNITASSSSRGPNGNADILKPDIIAPGSEILSGFSPDQGGENFAFLTGTSMSGPHVAGAAALVIQQHPTWTPAQVKTALTSTSQQAGLLKENGTTAADPFDVGAGRMDLAAAVAAGATFDKASMADDACFVECTFSRTIRNELGATTTWNATVTGTGPGLGVVVAPASVTLASGESASFTVTADVALGTPGVWEFGNVVWTPVGGGAPAAHLPVAVLPAAATGTASVTANKTADVTEIDTGDPITWTINLSNLNVPSTITLSDPIPAGATFVPGSQSATVNGVPDAGFTYDGVANTLDWSGTLAQQAINVTSPAADTLYGFFPLSSLGVSPIGCTGCDEATLPVTGLDFYYLGVHYTSALMNSNGFIVPGGASVGTDPYLPQDMPDAVAPNNVLAPLWFDIDMDGTSATDTGAGIWRMATIGDGTTDWHVFEWDGVEEWGVAGNLYSFQIWIEVGTSNITYIYGAMNAVMPTAVAVGAENATGTNAGMLFYKSGASTTGTAPATSGSAEVTTTAGGSAEFTFQTTASGATGPIVNIATFSDGAMTRSVTATVLNLGTAPSFVALQKTVTDAGGDGTATRGEVLTYTITVPNDGFQTATNVVIADTPPANTTLVAGTVVIVSNTGGGTPTVVSGNALGDTAVQVDVDTIASGGSVVVRFDVRVADNLPPGSTLTNVAQVSATGITTLDSPAAVISAEANEVLVPALDSLGLALLATLLAAFGVARLRGAGV